jgi:2,5-furandicarboxylate decarboxylase 1
MTTIMLDRDLMCAGGERNENGEPCLAQHRLGKIPIASFRGSAHRHGEVEIHDEPVSLTNLSTIIERTGKAALFNKAGPERAQIVAKTAGSRKRLAAAFETSEDKLYDEYFKRLSSPQPVVEVPSGEAPVHEVKITGKDVDLTKLPFHPQHAYDGSCYLSSAIDYTIDSATGRRNVGCRRLSLRNRYETGTNVTAPSDLKRIYTACVARGERLPITFTVGTHPLDFVAATMRQPGDELSLVATLRGEPAPIVKSLTSDIRVPQLTAGSLESPSASVSPTRSMPSTRVLRSRSSALLATPRPTC